MGFLSSVPPVGGDISHVTSIINKSRVSNYTKEDNSKFITEIRKWLGKNKGNEDQISCAGEKWAEFGKAIVKIVKDSPEALGTIIAIEDAANRRFGNLPLELKYYTFEGPDGDQKIVLVKQIEGLNCETLNAVFRFNFEQKKEMSMNLVNLSPEVFIAVTDFLETGLSNEEKIAEALDEVFDFAVQYNLEELIRGCWNLTKSAYSEAVKLRNKKEINRLKGFIQKMRDICGSNPLVNKVIDREIDPFNYPNFFGKEQWEKYFGEVGDVPPLPEDIKEILDSPCPIWGGKKVSETHTLLLIPAIVNGEQFSLDSLEKLAKCPWNGNETMYKFYDKDVKSEYGKTSVVKAYWVLITNDLLPRSRDKSLEEQQKMVEAFNGKVPRALEAAALNIVTYVSIGKRLYGDGPFTFTHCQEKVKGKWSLVVGGFASGGLGISCSSLARDYIGVAMRRKF